MLVFQRHELALVRVRTMLISALDQTLFSFDNQGERPRNVGSSFTSRRLDLGALGTDTDSASVLPA